MSAQAKPAATGLGTFILLVALAVLCGSVFAFYYFAGDYPAWIRAVGLLVATVLSVVIAVQSEKGRTVWEYVRQSRTEVRKVVWPTRQETMQTTLMVLIVVIILGVFLWLGDIVLLRVVQFLTGQEVE